MKKPIVISGFPGIGKSHCAREYPEQVIDLDSTQFHDEGQLNVYTYTQKILMLQAENKHKYILVSTHKQLRETMHLKGIDFMIAMPPVDRRSKYAYIERYKKRNDSKKFIDKLRVEWLGFLADCFSDYTIKIVLPCTIYLNDYIKRHIGG